MKPICQLVLCLPLLWGLPAALAQEPGAQSAASNPASAPPATPPQSPVAPPDSPANAGRLDLIRADFPQGVWSHYSAKKDSPLAETWTVIVEPQTSQRILVCKGDPSGYLRSIKEYRDFELSLEWRFPSENSGNNSGILLFTSGEDKIWPTSMQVQLYQPEVGRTFPHGAAKSTGELRQVPQAALPAGSWNRCLIVCRSGTIRVTVNDKSLGEVTGCLPSAGSLGLQSEGSEIHFRNIFLRELAADPVTNREPASGADNAAAGNGIPAPSLVRGDPSNPPADMQ